MLGVESAERQQKAGADGQVALEAEQKRACRGAAGEGDQPEERGMVPEAQQLPEAVSDPLRSGLERNLPECSSAGARGGGAERRRVARKGAEQYRSPLSTRRV